MRTEPLGDIMIGRKYCMVPGHRYRIDLYVSSDSPIHTDIDYGMVDAQCNEIFYPKEAGHTAEGVIVPNVWYPCSFEFTPSRSVSVLLLGLFSEESSSIWFDQITIGDLDGAICTPTPTWTPIHTGTPSPTLTPTPRTLFVQLILFQSGVG
jgi:hypothetical protein